MEFDFKAKLQKAKEGLADMGVEKAQEVLSQVNLLLRLLQDAGYEVSELDAELGLPPTVTIELKTGPAVSETKLKAILQANQDKPVLAAILESLIEANKLRDSVTLETLELKVARIVLKASPSIELQWKAKKTSA